MKILFITLSNIGDAILTLPLLSALNDRFLNARIDVMVGPRSKEIFIKDPRVNMIFTYDKHWGLTQKIDFIKKLRLEKYDLCVDMKTSLVPFLIGAKDRTKIFSINKTRVKHKKLLHLDRLKALGIGYRNQRNIYIDEEDKQTVKELLKKGVGKEDILIGIAPSGRSYLKQWPIERFIDTINNLLKDKKYKVVLMGEANQASISKDIKNGVRDEGLIDLTGKLDLNELFALIDRLSLLLTCDSASLHIASDLGVKVVALFGSTDPEEYGPTGRDDIAIRKNLECSPCKKALCKFDHECMKEITVKEVLKAVRKLL